MTIRKFWFRKLFVFFLLFGTPAYSQSVDVIIDEIGSSLIDQLAQRGITSLAVLDFEDINGRTRGLGKFLAEELSITMIGNDQGIAIIDRGNLRRLMDEMSLTASGLVNPDNAKRLGEIAGVDALVFGTISPTEYRFRIQIRVISVETAEVVAGIKFSLDRSGEVRELWEQIISKDNSLVGGSEPQITRREQVEKDSILEIVLLNLAKNSQQEFSRNYPTLNVSFLMKNITQGEIGVQFDSPNNFLSYQDASGVYCAYRKNGAEMRSNLGFGFSSGIDGRYLEYLLPGDEMLVMVSGLQCSDSISQRTGLLSVNLSEVTENGDTWDSSFVFSNVELTGEH